VASPLIFTNLHEYEQNICVDAILADLYITRILDRFSCASSSVAIRELSTDTEAQPARSDVPIGCQEW
jgi:hypothetical protein